VLLNCHNRHTYRPCHDDTPAGIFQQTATADVRHCRSDDTASATSGAESSGIQSQQRTALQSALLPATHNHMLTQRIGGGSNGAQLPKKWGPYLFTAVGKHSAGSRARRNSPKTKQQFLLLQT
jgi:hypothetical protein